VTARDQWNSSDSGRASADGAGTKVMKRYEVSAPGVAACGPGDFQSLAIRQSI